MEISFYCYPLSQASIHPQLSCLQYEKQQKLGVETWEQSYSVTGILGGHSENCQGKGKGGRGIYSEMHIMLWSSGGMHPHENFEV